MNYLNQLRQTIQNYPPVQRVNASLDHLDGRVFKGCKDVMMQLRYNRRVNRYATVVWWFTVTTFSAFFALNATHTNQERKWRGSH